MHHIPALALQHIELLRHLSYFGVFIAVVLAGHFVPVPEDLSLVFAGYIVALGYAKLFPMLIVATIGPVVADAILYYLTKAGSRFVPKADKYAEKKMFKTAMHYMHNHTILAVIVMRFVTGFRFLSPVVGAYINIPPKKYFLANLISAAIYGPFFVLLGYSLSNRIAVVVKAMRSIEHFALLLLSVLIVAVIGFLIEREYNNRHAKE